MPQPAYLRDFFFIKKYNSSPDYGKIEVRPTMSTKSEKELYMPILTHKQLTLAEIYSDCSNSFENDKHHFLSLLEENLNLSDYIPITFYNKYYASTGRPREHELLSMLSTADSDENDAVEEDDQSQVKLYNFKTANKFPKEQISWSLIYEHSTTFYKGI